VTLKRCRPGDSNQRGPPQCNASLPQPQR